MWLEPTDGTFWSKEKQTSFCLTKHELWWIMNGVTTPCTYWVLDSSDNAMALWAVWAWSSEANKNTNENCWGLSDMICRTTKDWIPYKELSIVNLMQLYKFFAWECLLTATLSLNTTSIAVGSKTDAWVRPGMTYVLLARAVGCLSTACSLRLGCIRIGSLACPALLY